MKPCLIYTTCKDEEEAEDISSALLDKKLIACAKKFPVSSSFLWKGEMDKSDEIFLIFETFEDKFDEIEEEIKKLHSYETYILFAIPVIKSSKNSEKWLKESV